jgi:hypothetical protein
MANSSGIGKAVAAVAVVTGFVLVHSGAAIKHGVEDLTLSGKRIFRDAAHDLEATAGADVSEQGNKSVMHDEIVPHPPISAIAANAIDQNNPNVREAVSLMSKSEPRVLSDLKSSGPMTAHEVEKIVVEEITKDVQAAAKKPESGITFEVLSGKLTIENYVNVGGDRKRWCGLMQRGGRN